MLYIFTILLLFQIPFLMRSTAVWVKEYRYSGEILRQVTFMITHNILLIFPCIFLSFFIIRELQRLYISCSFQTFPEADATQQSFFYG